MRVHAAVRGAFEKVYTDWYLNPQHGTAAEQKAALLWPKIEAYQKEHGLLWTVAPLSPPYGWRDQKVTWGFFVRVNWLFLVWLVLLVGSAFMAASGMGLLKLVDELNHEEKLDKMRMKRGRGRTTAGVPGVTSIEIRNEIEVRAAETGKWWGLNGAVIGGALATILATLVLRACGIG